MPLNRVLRAAAALPLALSFVAAAPDAPPAADHVGLLAGTWSCRTLEGATTHHVGTRDGDRIEVRNDVVTAAGRRGTVRDLFVFEPAANRWAVSTGAGSRIEVDGAAPPWTTPVWDIRARAGNGALERIRYELFDNGEMRRSFSRPATGTADDWWTLSAERCRPGDVPPPPGSCIFSTAPAHVVDVWRPNGRGVAVETNWGDVKVQVDLDESSRVIDAKVLETPSPVLNPAALLAARNSTYHTAVKDCMPMRSSVVLVMHYGPPVTR